MPITSHLCVSPRLPLFRDSNTEFGVQVLRRFRSESKQQSCRPIGLGCKWRICGPSEGGGASTEILSNEYCTQMPSNKHAWSFGFDCKIVGKKVCKVSKNFLALFCIPISGQLSNWSWSEINPVGGVELNVHKLVKECNNYSYSTSTKVHLCDMVVFLRLFGIFSQVDWIIRLNFCHTNKWLWTWRIPSSPRDYFGTMLESLVAERLV